MQVMYWLIPVAILLLAIAIAAFVWAVRNDQYSDLDSPAYKILFDDDSTPTESNDENSSKSKDTKIDKNND